MEDNVQEDAKQTVSKTSSTSKTGIIYLSRVPTLMNVNIARRYFERFGEIGRIFLQPDLKAPSRGKHNRAFSEGWVEFQNKKIAKHVAASLNNTQIGGKKKNKWREELWNIKYLHRFKWAHLNERLAYEKAVHSQRMRTEIAQAKREANFYIQNAERNETKKRMDKKRLKRQAVDGGSEISEETQDSERPYEFRLKETEDEILKKRKSESKGQTKGNKKQKTSAEVNSKGKSFLTKIFSAGVDDDSD